MNEKIFDISNRQVRFLFSLKLIRIIKSNQLNLKYILRKNQKYINTFKEIDKVILLKNNFFSKIKLIFLRKEKYDAIIIHDGKIDAYIFFLRYEKKAICVTNLINTNLI